MLATTTLPRKAGEIGIEKTFYQIAIKVHLFFAVTRLAFSSRTVKSSKRRALTFALLKYAVKGQFPTNTYQEGITPVFRDKSGVMCAMGYLAYVDGQHELVNEIVKSNNLIDLSKESNQGFNQWLRSVNITPKEAAFVQPGYSWQEPVVSDPQLITTSQELLLLGLLILPLYLAIIGIYAVLGKRIISDSPTTSKAMKTVFRLSVWVLVIMLVFLVITSIAYLRG